MFVGQRCRLMDVVGGQGAGFSAMTADESFRTCRLWYNEFGETN